MVVTDPKEKACATCFDCENAFRRFALDNSFTGELILCICVCNTMTILTWKEQYVVIDLFLKASRAHFEH